MRLVTNPTGHALEARESQIARLSSSANSERDLPALLDRAVMAVTTGLRLDACAVLKVSSDRDVLHFVASAGWPESVAQHAHLPTGLRSQEGYTLSTRKPVVSNDLTRERRFHTASIVRDQKLASGISVVVEGETGAFGVLVGHTKQSRRFSTVDVDFVRAVAHILSECIRRLHADRDRARLSAIVESANDAIIGTTLDGTIFSWNPAAEGIFGFRKADAIGQPVGILFPHAHVPRPSLACASRPLGGPVGPYETICQRRNGAPIDVEISVSSILSSGGHAVGESLIVRDVTERTRSERALRMHACLFDRMQIGVVIARLDDPDNPSSLRLTLANEAGASAAGFPPETAPRGRLADLCLDTLDPDHVRRYGEVARSGRDDDFGDCVLRGADAAARVFNIHAIPLPDHSVGVIFHDVTAQRQLAHQLQQAQRMEVVGRLAGGVAHDFNNLLTVIGGCAELVGRTVGADPALGDELAEIQQAVESASALTRQLLTFSRRPVSRPTHADLASVVARVRGMLRRLIGEDIQVVVVSGDCPATVYADMSQVEQIVLNLAVNARDAMPGGGQIAIETGVIDLSAEEARRLGYLSPGRYATMTIADTGSGMDQATCDRIFEPFFTTKESGKGTGLGLSTVYAIVKQHDGHVEVRSEPGHGSVFRVYLPLAEVPQSDGPTETAVRDLCVGSETILVVEDEVPVQNLVRRLLSRAGYTVLAASVPSEALAIAARHSGPIDLLLSDVVMPEHSGHDLADLLLAGRPGLRVLLMSGYAPGTLPGRAVLDTSHAFIAKPFTGSDLLSAVRRALDASSPAASGREPCVVH
jgi:two-component system, cell cycle sensor histidine kinase and response regulator CckA